MADPAVAVASTSAAPATPPLATESSPLLEQALALVLDHVAAPRGAAWRFGPLAIVSPAENAASDAVLAAARGRGLALDGDTVSLHSGRSLDGEIAAALDGDRLERLAETLSASRLVVVDRIDRVAGSERGQSLVHLLDHAAAHGTIWAVSTPAHPSIGAGTQVDSRLSGGLVVPPTTTPVWRASAGATPSLARIIRSAAKLHDVEPAVMIGPSRRRTVAAARSLAMYLARRLTGHSLQAIGAACGGRDHSTVLHGVRVCTARIARDPSFSAEVERLATALGATGPDGEAGTRPRPPGVGSATLARGLRSRRRTRRRLA